MRHSIPFQFSRRLCSVSVAAFSLLGGASNVLGEPVGHLTPTTSATFDWPCLYGPTHDSVSPETNLALDWNQRPPKVVWKATLGEGYSAPAIAGNRLIAFHRLGNEEVVDALDSLTGERRWRQTHPTHYEDRYGYNNGPRATPIVDRADILTLGAEGALESLALNDGAVRWRRSLQAEYGVEQGFFGVGASPLLEGDRLIINLGAKERNAGVIAVDRATGKTVWTATDQGASYATPRAATIHGARHVFVFTEAGLVDLAPSDGTVRWSIPFRSRLYESVNATSPLVVGARVLVSATYGTGSLCGTLLPDGSWREDWRNPRGLESHFSNMIEVDGFVYAFSGRHEGGAALCCVELATGKFRWKHESDLGRGSMLRVGRNLILWGERGNLAIAAVNPDRYEQRAFLDEPLLSYPCWTPPALSRGLLYLRNEKNLLCLDLGGQMP